MLALSGGYFFFHAMCINTEADMPEEVGSWVGPDCVGEAIAHICVTAINLLKKDPQHPHSVPENTLRVCAFIVRNAQLMAARGTPGLRCDATGNELHPCQQIVGVRAINRLMDFYRAYL